MKKIPVAAIYERDIDLLVLEELTVNPKFRGWFYDQNQFPKEAKFIGAWNSISDFGLGETDLLISYESKDQKVFILIENKLDADFTKNQGRRYLERANLYKSEGKCTDYFILLIAPFNYCENQNRFKNYFSYEKIKTWFESQNDERSKYKSRTLEIAINKLRRGYHAENDPRCLEFWTMYRNLLLSKNIDIGMSKPIAVPTNSDWPNLTNNYLKSIGISIWHKLSKGYIDAQFKSKKIEDKLNEIEIPSFLSIVQTGKSHSIRILTEPLDRLNSFDDQSGKVEYSIDQAIKLVNWIKENLKF